MYVEDLFTTYFGPNRSSSGITYTKTTKKRYCIMRGLYSNETSFSQLIVL